MTALPGAPREPPLIAIVGPTASGKTAVALALSARINGELVSADAVAVYRGMDIGTAKPTQSEQSRARFHLIDVADPDEDFTVADFEARANAAIADIRRRGRTPILVGGTGLYVRSVTSRLAVPPVPPQPELRKTLWERVERDGARELHAELTAVDPTSASKILPGDAKRIIRALEVFEVTGRPLSTFHTAEGVHGIPRENTLILGLHVERPELYRRIERRVDIMMEDGLLDEVRGLRAAGYGTELKSQQSLGYRQLSTYLSGAGTLEEAVVATKRDTRRFAKRQISWFNGDPRLRWIDGEPELVAQAIVERVERLANERADMLIPDA